MPINYACPHCAKQFSVADQYAGQTGPCAGCGQTITIPVGLSGPSFYTPKPSGGGGAAIAVVMVTVLVVLVAIVGVLAALLIPAVGAARQAAKRMQSQNNLKQIALAIHNYHDVYGVLPPAVVTDASGKPLYSGRVLLLPYLEQSNLYEMWDKSAAWDSPANRGLSQTVIATFRDPADVGPAANTSYLFVSGTGTMFETGKKLKLQDLTDGTSNTLMFVEVKQSGINWAEPLEWDAASRPLPPGNHRSGNQAAMADGSVRSLAPQTPRAAIGAAVTRAGGEAVYLP